MLKRAILNMLKIVAAIAAVVALFVPLGTFDQALVFFVAVAVGIISLVVSSELADDDPGNDSFWPPKANK